LFAGFIVLAAPMVRNLPLVPPAALIILGPAWTAAAAEVARTSPLRQGRLIAATALVILVVAAAWLRLTDRMSGPVRAPMRTGWGIDTDRFPSAAADFIERERLPGPLLNNFDIGGYLLYRLHPRRRVFIAGNTAMFPLSFLEYYRQNVTGTRPDPDELHVRHGVETIVIDLITNVTHGLVSQLASNPAWALVFLDRAGAVFLHVDDNTRALTDRLRVDVDARAAALAKQDRSDPAIPEWLGGRRLLYPSFSLAQFLPVIGRPDLALREAERLWQRTPAENLAVTLGQSAMTVGQMAASVPRLEDAYARYPHSDQIRALLGHALAFRVDALLTRNALAEAKRDLERMLVLDPHACGPYAGLAKVALLETDEARARVYVAHGTRNDRDGQCRQRAAQDPLLGPFLARESDRGRE